MLIRNNLKALVTVFIPGAAPGSERMRLPPGSVTDVPDEILENEGNRRLLGCGDLELMDESHGSRVQVRNTRGRKVRLEVPLAAEDLPYATAPPVKVIEIQAGETADIREEFLHSRGAKQLLEAGILEVAVRRRHDPMMLIRHLREQPSTPWGALTLTEGENWISLPSSC